MTIVPSVIPIDYWNVLADPDEISMARYEAEGERSAWPKINMIRNRVVIENKLYELINKHKSES